MELLQDFTLFSESSEALNMSNFNWFFVSFYESVYGRRARDIIEAFALIVIIHGYSYMCIHESFWQRRVKNYMKPLAGYAGCFIILLLGPLAYRINGAFNDKTEFTLLIFLTLSWSVYGEFKCLKKSLVFFFWLSIYSVLQ